MGLGDIWYQHLYTIKYHTYIGYTLVMNTSGKRAQHIYKLSQFTCNIRVCIQLAIAYTHHTYSPLQGHIHPTHPHTQTHTHWHITLTILTHFVIKNSAIYTGTHSSTNNLYNTALHPSVDDEGTYSLEGKIRDSKGAAEASSSMSVC